MADSTFDWESGVDSEELADALYFPAGITVTPQARRFGYEFPVYVSDVVWSNYCMYSGSSRHGTNQHRRIVELLQYCYEGMTKRLAVSDDFVFYYFKIWFYDRNATGKEKKKHRARLGARLFIDPQTGVPWLYIFHPERDHIQDLKKGDPNGFVEEHTHDDECDCSVEHQDGGLTQSCPNVDKVSE